MKSTGAVAAGAGEEVRWVDEVLAAVVTGALFGVAERFVGLADFLEAARRVLVVRVLVRVVDDGQFAVGFLDVVIRRVLFDAQDLVEILAFGLFEFELGGPDFFG